MVVGLFGPTTGGKDHLALNVQKYLIEHGKTCSIYAYADRVKEIVCKEYEVTREELETLKRNHDIIDGNKTMRDVIIATGLKVNSKDNRYFLNYVHDKVKSDKNEVSIITDPRLLTEINHIVEENGFFIFIENNRVSDKSKQLEDLPFLKQYLHSYENKIYVDNTGYKLTDMDYRKIAKQIIERIV